MKVKELVFVKKDKIGHINRNGVITEPNEKKTLKYLVLFGFNIDIIVPSNTHKTKNPDVLIMGTIWELKTPTSSNKNTIKNRFREAANQATKIIFDLRFVKKDTNKVNSQIVELFKGDGKVRRMIIIEKNGKTLDYIK